MKRISILLIAFLTLGAALPSAQQPSPGPAGERRPGAVLQGLDKITARISTIEAPLDMPVRFGTLDIVVRACYRTPPTEPPESTAFLEIDDNRANGNRVRAYSGWMFASSPALAAMEHPVYDVWVVDCMKSSSAEAPSSG
ncbi:MAG: DUF2155 domain-containing protein [Alphaproteobacteria bacterium]|jgi:hypothetical protein